MSDFSPFVHLHVHSHYSIGDSINTIDNLYKKTNEYNMKAVALTDHGNLFGAAEFMLSAAKYKLKPIIGCEMYITPNDMKSRKIEDGEARYYHLVLLAKDAEGYKNLVELVSLGYLEGFYYKPRIDFKTLEQHSKGLIASSACLAGEIPRLIQANDMTSAEKRILYYSDLFGPDNFFLEIMDHGMQEQKEVNAKILELSKKTNIPIIATNDMHYTNRDDFAAHDVFLCIGSGKKVTDQKRLKYSGDQFYYKSYEEMKVLFGDVCMESLTNTVSVADMCNYYPETGGFKFPAYEVPNQKSYDDYLREMCYEKLPQKVEDFSDKMKERLDYELGVISKMGFSSYFLITQDFINYAKNNGVNVGPGRGSAAGCLVSYAVGITELNPLKYDLLFERFLNPGRVSMPDIDTDFDDWGREKVIDYVKERYGEDKVAQIITFGRLKARAVIRDVGRVLDIPLNEVDAIAKMIPGTPGTKLKTAIAEVPELKAKIESMEIYGKLWDYALRLENLVRHTSIHAAGIIIGKDKLSSTVPLYRDSKTGAISTQFEGSYLEDFGLLKLDFLGLRNLRIISEALKLIKKHQNVEIDLEHIALDDKKTYQLLQKGSGIGVFQCESDGMRELMKRLKPNKIEDVIALIALYRPGPLNSGMTEDFVKRKNKPELIKYPHQDIASVLEDTYGVIVYQEQVMLISQVIGGFSLSEADDLRKAMGKKIREKMEKLGTKFIEGAQKGGYDRGFAENLFNQMEKFAEYGFNKSHSAAYAYIAYQTAYLKAHYPVEYMAALLNAEKNKIESLVKYLKECKDMKIKVLPPDVNLSQVDFSVEGENEIRFGLSAIKNVGEANITEIIEERENGKYSSLTDLVSRVDVNRKVLETFTLTGTLDQLISNRATVIHNIEKILDFSSLKKKERKSGMKGLFDMGDEVNQVVDTIQIENVEEFKENELLKMEKVNLGLYVTGHPLAKFENKINAYSTHTSRKMAELKSAIEASDSVGMDVPEKVDIGGVFDTVMLKKTKRNDNMAICMLEDLESEIKVVVFPRVYSTNFDKINTNNPVLIKGNIDFIGKEVQIRAVEIKLLKDMSTKIKTKIINIKIDEKTMKSDTLTTLEHILMGNKGTDPVIFHLYDLDTNKKVNIKAGKDYYIPINDAILEKIRHINCVEDIWVTGGK